MEQRGYISVCYLPKIKIKYCYNL